MHIAFDAVHKSYGSGAKRKRAVVNVSWEAHGGEVIGLLGPTGAGKSSIMRLLLDLLRPDQGVIRIDGVDHGNRTAEFKRRLGYLPESTAMYPGVKVIDMLVYMGALKGLSMKDARVASDKWLERFGLTAARAEKVSSLSKGMTQKVQMAGALLHEPDLVVFDEPFTGLDPVNVRMVRQLVRDLRDAKKLVFISSHRMGELELASDRLMMIHGGEIKARGTVEEIARLTEDRVRIIVDSDTDVTGLSTVESSVTLTGDTGEKRTLVVLISESGLSDFVRELVAKDRSFRRIEEVRASLEDFFVTMVGEGGPD